MTENVYLLINYRPGTGEHQNVIQKGVFRSPTRAFAYVDKIEKHVGHEWQREGERRFVERMRRWEVVRVPFNPEPHEE